MERVGVSEGKLEEGGGGKLGRVGLGGVSRQRCLALS